MNRNRCSRSPEYEPTVVEFIKVAECECWADCGYLAKSAGQMLNDEEGGVPPEHWTNGMLGFSPTKENQDEEEQIYP